MSYIRDDFLLKNQTAKRLYDTYAKDMPIFDYHCHLPEKQILENKPFSDIYEIWLAGDHYKWRLMRNYGVNEEYITGSASNKDKFLTYCRVLGTAFGNPLYHWSQLELETFFSCGLEINEENAERIWDECNAYIKAKSISPVSLIKASNVTHIFTTNEIFDDLSVFEEIAKKNYGFRVIPAFRADKIMNIEAPAYLTFIGKLEALTHKITDMGSLEAAIEKRLCEFINVGTCASDIALERVCDVSGRAEADAVLRKALSGAKISTAESEIFKGYFTYFLMRLYSENDIRTELHVGAMRNNNSRMLARLGLDTGYDSISEDNSIKAMSRLFDRLDSEGKLPATIVFNLNPKMNTEIMTLLGAFQSDGKKGKMQYGPAWWFLDNKPGMEKHLSDLTATGHLAAFVGMLTDSRSFLSYPRHHYFRRILCSFLGEMMEHGEMTANEALVGRVVRDISYNNSVEYFGV